MTSCSSFFSFYQKQFLPAYLRMKETLRDGKPFPQPIADGITDSFTYLCHSYDSGSDLEEQARISLALDALVETKNKMIELLNRQLSLHPRRSFAAVVIIFIASGFINAFLKNIYDQMLGPYVLQFLKSIGS